MKLADRCIDEEVVFPVEVSTEELSACIPITNVDHVMLDVREAWSGCGWDEFNRVFGKWVEIKPDEKSVIIKSEEAGEEVEKIIDWILDSYDSNLKPGQEDAWQIYNLGGDDDVDYYGSYVQSLADAVSNWVLLRTKKEFNIGGFYFDTIKLISSVALSRKFSIYLDPMSGYFEICDQEVGKEYPKPDIEAGCFRVYIENK